MRRGSCLALIVLVMIGCDDPPCDPDQTFREGFCFQNPKDAGVLTDAAGEAGAVTGMFGKPCVDDVSHTDCAAPAGVCLKQPGQAMGFCSAIGCDKDPAVCPMDWNCLDLSLLVPGAPWACVKF